ncbi:MAG: hypothetical protein JOZ69_22145, partial [Myxococcales bacterium]|nr:hypothetical protein [Myxococcales bacterium]
MTHRTARFAGAALALVAVAIAFALTGIGCQQAATNAAARTLELPTKMDVVCLEVNDALGNPLMPPQKIKVHPASECPAVATTNTNPAALPLHLFGVVIQSRRGEVAVLDLTAGTVIDVDKTTPGTDFIPVGANPTDITVAPSGTFTFVTSGATNKFGIYAIDNARLLGNSTSVSAPPPAITDNWTCGLTQPPQAVAVLSEAPSPTGGAAPAFVLAVVLGNYAGAPGQLATVGFDPNAGAMEPGVLAPCTVLGSTAFSGAVPDTTSLTALTWPDGVPDAGAGSARIGPLDYPPLGPTCPTRGGDGGAPSIDASGGGDAEASEAGSSDAEANDAQASDAAPGDAPAGLDAGAPVESGAGTPVESGAPAPAWTPPASPQPTSLVLRSDQPYAYVADNALPLIHVIDLHDPANPQELDPLVATSVLAPQEVAVGPIALSPPTHDYRMYLYAVDARQGSLMVFDVTDAPATSRVPLQRPHAGLTPLAPIDRIAFAAPVKAVAFAQHDWPLNLPSDPTHSYTGLICNPNPLAYDGGSFSDRGGYYRADQTAVIQPNDSLGGTVQTIPLRLRGVFAFATLSTGSVVTIDVDDWDA